MLNRKSNRLSCYDYSLSGFYFITICTKGHINWFGEINEGVVELSNLGEVAKSCLIDIPNHFKLVKVDECFVIMPNHVHLIVIIDNEINVENNYVGNSYGHSLRMKMTLSNVINGYKSSVTRQIRQQFDNYEFAWQKSYYDHIIRSDKELSNIYNYISNNPFNLNEDYPKFLA